MCIYALFWSQWLEEIEPVKLWSPLKVITAFEIHLQRTRYLRCIELYCIVHKSYVQDIWVVSCCYVRKSYWLSIWIESVIGRSCDTHTISLQLPSITIIFTFIIFFIIIVVNFIIINNNSMENIWSCYTHTISLQLPSIEIIFIIVVVTLIIIMNSNNMENIYVIIFQYPHLSSSWLRSRFPS